MSAEPKLPGAGPSELERRGFLLKAATVAVGGASMVPPILAGLAVTLDPVARGTSAPSGFVKVATLEALPKDGVPRKFAVIAERQDVWNRFPNTPVGAVYLRRTGDREVSALNVSCPHAGCFVNYVPARNHFFCPCHNSAFNVDGAIQDPRSPAARPLDSLDIELKGNEIWVRFQNFRTGTAAKLPV